jgi:hypothetical protein
MASLSARELRGIAVITLQHRWALIWVPNKLNTEETRFDAYVREFEERLDILESIESMDSGAVPKDHRYLNFSFTLQNFTTLYLTAVKCRNPNLRRRSLALLKSSPKREGFWDSSIVIKMVERVIEIEGGDGRFDGYDGLSSPVGMVEDT